ncbi:S8 family serine peptidase [Sphingobium sp. JS3065]|nr:S8 family serine peptidase [Sphingobium sp. JS3065]
MDDGKGGTDLNQISTFSNRAGAGADRYLTALGYRDRTINQDGAAYLYSGTSFSAPVISGAVALMAQAFPNLTSTQIIDILFRTADDLGGAGTDATFGKGRLNIARAFQPIGATTLAGTGVAVRRRDTSISLSISRLDESRTVLGGQMSQIFGGGAAGSWHRSALSPVAP